MPTPTRQQDADTRRKLGVWLAQIGNQSTNADLRASLDALYVKIVGVPWVPPDWYGQVAALQRTNPDMIVLPSPDPVVWITTPAQRDFWTQLVLATNKARSAYGAGLQAQGKAELERLVSNAAFWDAAYRYADALDPSKAAGRAVNTFFGSMGGTTKLIVGGLVIVAGLYFLSKMIGKRSVQTVKANPGRRRRRQAA